MAKFTTRNQLRIIGGKWRGRKIHFPDAADLRPTADRIRETVFNWLAGYIEGSTCVDLFAGSGALGFEAGSRGAARVLLVEQDPNIATYLQQTTVAFNATAVDIVTANTLNVISDLPATNILFLDPPFKFTHLDELLQRIDAGNFLQPKAWIYLETAADRAIVTPAGWRLHRHKQAGQVAYRLFQRQA